MVINGDDVTATGLLVEHNQQYDTVWDGERGTTVLHQDELPYDPPSRGVYVFDHVMTVDLGAGEIEHVVNGVGGSTDDTATGAPVYVIDHP